MYMADKNQSLVQGAVTLYVSELPVAPAGFIFLEFFLYLNEHAPREHNCCIVAP